MNKIIYSFKNTLKDNVPIMLSRAIANNDTDLLEKIGKVLQNQEDRIKKSGVKANWYAISNGRLSI